MLICVYVELCNCTFSLIKEILSFKGLHYYLDEKYLTNLTPKTTFWGKIFKGSRENFFPHVACWSLNRKNQVSLAACRSLFFTIYISASYYKNNVWYEKMERLRHGHFKIKLLWNKIKLENSFQTKSFQSRLRQTYQYVWRDKRI